jgi:AraC-like DNA-binding protein
VTIAARLLRTGDIPLGAIAAGIGHTSTLAFSAAFKRRRNGTRTISMHWL